MPTSWVIFESRLVSSHFPQLEHDSLVEKATVKCGWLCVRETKNKWTLQSLRLSLYLLDLLVFQRTVVVQPAVESDLYVSWLLTKIQCLVCSSQTYLENPGRKHVCVCGGGRIKEQAVSVWGNDNKPNLVVYETLLTSSFSSQGPRDEGTGAG